MAPRSKPQSVSTKRNENGKPILNKNTIKQAEKPSSAAVTLPPVPVPGASISNEISQLEAALKQKAAETLDLQDRLAQALIKLDRAKRIIEQQKSVLSKMGIGGNNPLEL